MKPTLSLLVILMLSACANPPKGKPEILYYQVYSNNDEVDRYPDIEFEKSKDPEWWALRGPASSVAAMQRELEKHDISFETEGSYLSIDPFTNHSMTFMSSYHRQSFVVVNTESNLKKADKFFTRNARCHLVGNRKVRYPQNIATADDPFAAPLK
jgi:hypothetical protein